VIQSLKIAMHEVASSDLLTLVTYWGQRAVSCGYVKICINGIQLENNSLVGRRAEDELQVQPEAIKHKELPISVRIQRERRSPYMSGYSTPR